MTHHGDLIRRTAGTKLVRKLHGNLQTWYANGASIYENVFLFTAHRRHMAKQAQASSKPHGHRDHAGATGLNFTRSVNAGLPQE